MEYPKILCHPDGQNQIVSDADGEKAARDAGFVLWVELPGNAPAEDTKAKKGGK